MRTHVLLLVVVASVPRVAGGQGNVRPAPAPVAEPRLPSNPQSPTDFQTTVDAPGMPQPAGAPAAAAPGVAAPTSYSGSDMVVDGGSNPALYGGRGPARRVPAYHQVTKGDTLWGLCDHYYADPWAWPQVWAHNKQISNPHWIYPGDRVRLLHAPTITASRGGERGETLRVTGREPRWEQPMVQLRQNAFVEPKELDRAGTVAGSPAERIMLSVLDEIYVEGSDRFQVQRGQFYTIYRVRQELKAEGKSVGYVVEILGTAQVRSVDPKKVATAVITESLAPIERGYRVGPLRRRFVRVPIRPASETVEGKVLATMRTGKYVSSDEVVFLSGGRNQGVREGNRFLVVRQGDGYKRLLQEQDDKNPKFPLETVAEITVVDARDDSSVGLITRSVKEVKIGDNVRTRRGY